MIYFSLSSRLLWSKGELIIHVCNLIVYQSPHLLFWNTLNLNSFHKLKNPLTFRYSYNLTKSRVLWHNKFLFHIICLQYFIINFQCLWYQKYCNTIVYLIPERNAKLELYNYLLYSRLSQT